MLIWFKDIKHNYISFFVAVFLSLDWLYILISGLLRTCPLFLLSPFWHQVFNNKVINPAHFFWTFLGHFIITRDWLRLTNLGLEQTLLPTPSFFFPRVCFFLDLYAWLSKVEVAHFHTVINKFLGHFNSLIFLFGFFALQFDLDGLYLRLIIWG